MTNELREGGDPEIDVTYMVECEEELITIKCSIYGV